MDLTTVARDVLALLESEGVSLPEGVNELERTMREAVHRVGARASELHLAGKPLGYQGSSRACLTPHCGCNRKFMGHRPRTLATLPGQVTVARAYYHCPRCAAGYDIGSGRVESACKHVVAVRMKRSGMIGSDDGAQHVLSLRAVRPNGWWEAFRATKPLRAKAA